MHLLLDTYGFAASASVVYLSFIFDNLCTFAPKLQYTFGVSALGVK